MRRTKITAVRLPVLWTPSAFGSFSVQVCKEVQQALQMLHEVDHVLEQLGLFWANSEVRSRSVNEQVPTLDVLADGRAVML